MRAWLHLTFLVIAPKLTANASALADKIEGSFSNGSFLMLSGVFLILNFLDHYLLRKKWQEERQLLLSKQYLLDTFQRNLSLSYQNIHSFLSNEKTSPEGSDMNVLRGFHDSLQQQLFRDTTTIREEYLHLLHYLEMEQARPGQRFSFTLTLSPSIDPDLTIPTGLIRPFIENAIRHGILPLNRPGEINIHFKRQETQLLCLIQDNGTGIRNAMEKGIYNPNGEISRIREQLQRFNRHIRPGMHLHLADLRLMSGPSQGTRVILLLSPLVPMGKDKNC